MAPSGLIVVLFGQSSGSDCKAPHKPREESPPEGSGEPWGASAVSYKRKATGPLCREGQEQGARSEVMAVWGAGQG